VLVRRLAGARLQLRRAAENFYQQVAAERTARSARPIMAVQKISQLLGTMQSTHKGPNHRFDDSFGVP
jgi:hypothetical protein